MTQHGNARTDRSTPDAPVVVERDGGVATVRFNRPDAMNSLSVATKEALLAALTEVAEDRDVRCVVLTGTGRAFCVGQDLREHVGLLKGEDPSLWETVPRHYNPVVELLATMDEIYGTLVSIDFPDAITGGLRRTTDSLRAVLERTRGDLTVTINQRRLEQAVRSMQGSLGLPLTELNRQEDPEG